MLNEFAPENLHETIGLFIATGLCVLIAIFIYIVFGVNIDKKLANLSKKQ